MDSYARSARGACESAEDPFAGVLGGRRGTQPGQREQLADEALARLRCACLRGEFDTPLAALRGFEQDSRAGALTRVHRDALHAELRAALRREQRLEVIVAHGDDVARALRIPELTAQECAQLDSLVPDVLSSAPAQTSWEELLDMTRHRMLAECFAARGEAHMRTACKAKRPAGSKPDSPEQRLAAWEGLLGREQYHRPQQFHGPRLRAELLVKWRYQLCRDQADRGALASQAGLGSVQKLYNFATLMRVTSLTVDR